MPIPSQIIKQRKAYLRKNKLTQTEKNDCTVIALAVVTGATYGEAHETMRRCGRKVGRGYPLRHVLDRALARHNCEATGLAHHKGMGKTTKGINLPRDHRYLVFVRGHVLAVQYGLVKDWTDDRAKRIRAIYKVERKNK